MHQNRALALFINGEPLSAALFKPASIVQSVLLAVVPVFENWGWRWPLLNQLAKRPNLIGFYHGELRSQWIDPKTNQGIPPIPAFIVIRQTLSDIHIRLFTEQSQSGSLQGFISKQPDEHQELIFSYRNEPKIEHRARSPIHYGGAKVQISQDSKTLTGAYWTDRATIGGMSFLRFSRDTPSSFADAVILLNKPSAKLNSA
jgi:hypothetical protein